MTATTRAFRLFVSSTFEDFALERKSLARIVAPELRRFCLARGVDFQLVDLRWGISSLSAHSQHTLEICLSEIDRTLSLAAKPSFLVLLGERYGWRPLPGHIRPDLFERITEAISADDAESAALLRRRYRLDTNAIPPRFELVHSPDDDDEAVRNALRRGIERAGLSRSPDVRTFFWSATHHEIARGALSGISADHVVSCFRSLKGGSLALGPTAADEHAEEANAALADLRARLRRAANGHVHEFVADVHDGRVDDTYLGEFVDRVRRALESLVLEQLESAPPVSERDDGVDHEARSRSLAAGFVARTRERAQLREALATLEGQASLLVSGPGGSGKTTLMAAAAEDFRTQRPDAIVVERFVGTTPGSARAFALLTGMAFQLRHGIGLAEPLVPAVTMGEAIEQLQQVLRQASARQPIALFIDGLDQLDDNEDIDWLHRLVLPHVTIVWSAQSSSRAVNRHDESAVHEVVLDRLAVEESVAILDARLRHANRQLSIAQRAQVLPSVEAAGSPLYAQVAFQVVCSWRSWDEGFALSSTLDGLLASFFERLAEHDHGRVLVDRSLALLAASRHGLSEGEMLDLLSADEQVMAEFGRLYPHSPDSAQLPQIVWSRLIDALGSFLAIRGIQGSRLYAFSHRVIADFAKRTHLADSPDPYASLARYFDEQPRVIVETEGTAARLNARRLSELPAAWVRAGSWDRLSGLLNDFAFLMAKCEARLAEELVADVEDASRSPAGESLREVTAFMARHGVELRGDSDVWRANRVLMQTALDQLPGAPLQSRAQALLESGGYDGLWLRPAWPHAPDGVVCRIETGVPITDVRADEDRQLVVTLPDDRRRRWSLATGLALGEVMPSQVAPEQVSSSEAADSPGKTGDERQPLDLEDGWRVTIDRVDMVMMQDGIERLTIEKAASDGETATKDLEGSPVPLVSNSERQMRFALGSGRHQLRRVSPRRWAVWDERGNLAIWDLDISMEAAASRASLPEMATAHVGAFHRLASSRAVSHSLHGERDPRLSFWDCQTGERVNTTSLPPPQGRLGSDLPGTRWVTGCTSVSGLAIGWGQGATLGVWDVKSSSPIAMCALEGEFEILDAEPFWYSPRDKTGVAASSRERRSGEHLVIALLTSRGANVLFDASLMTGTAVYKSPPTRFPEYARRYEMFGFDVLADGRLARRYCNEFPMVYDLGEAFAAPRTYHPIVLEGSWNPSSPAQNPWHQVRRTIALAGGQFITLRGDEVAAYQSDGTLLRIWKGRDVLQLTDGRLLIVSASGATDGCGTISSLDDSLPTQALSASSAPINGAANLTEREILTWHEDNQFRLWDATSADLLDSCPQSDAWHRRPSWVQAWMAAAGAPRQCLDWRAWQSTSMVGLVHAGTATSSSAPAFAALYTGIRSEVLWIEPDGTLVIVRDSTQPRVLHLCRGNARVDLVTALSMSPVVQPFTITRAAAQMMAETSLATSDLLAHLAKDQTALDCQREALDDARRLLGDWEEPGDVHLRTCTERASLRIRQRDLEGALTELRVPWISVENVTMPSSTRLRYGCLRVSVLLIARYRAQSERQAEPGDDHHRPDVSVTDDHLAAFNEAIDLCRAEREWEAQLYALGLALAILGLRDQAGSAVSSAELRRWRTLSHIGHARDEFAASQTPLTGLLGPCTSGGADVAWLDAHLIGPRLAARPRAAVDIPSPHPAANADRAAALNIQYQRDLVAWRALPWLRRIRTKKPEPPTGI